MYKSYLNRTDLPRGIRNNNPGNLIRTPIAWNGKIPFAQSKDTKFEQFAELRYGIRAKMLDIINDVNEGTDTVAALITEFAPKFENNTQAYINTVASMVGLPMNAKIDLTEERLIALCKAISFVENGAAYANYITDQDYADALAILGRSLKKKLKASR